MKTQKNPDHTTWYLKQEAVHYGNLLIGEDVGDGFQQTKAAPPLLIPSSPPSPNQLVSPLSSPKGDVSSPVSPISPTSLISPVLPAPLSTPPPSPTLTDFHPTSCKQEIIQMDSTEFAIKGNEASPEVSTSSTGTASASSELALFDSSPSDEENDEAYADITLDELLQIENTVNVAATTDGVDDTEDTHLPRNSVYSVRQEPGGSSSMIQTPTDLTEIKDTKTYAIVASTGQAENRSEDGTEALDDDYDSEDSETTTEETEEKRRAEDRDKDHYEMVMAGFKYKEVMVTEGELKLFKIPSLARYRAKRFSPLRICWILPSSSDDTYDSDDEITSDEWDEMDMSEEEGEVELGPSPEL
ncbi:hypothetical protein HYFRA_00008540 [Hymenoscyphus fraxineus]|uniref:Uncharacterized protein n=1 Tax=Hymenoscyphus fraxineus TaxID=746836 RepID=A0A9N9KVX8_9HELO|nr:hypothetical protein HYFRA_00008540 [Hymenoscyphus fraxineus]